MPSSCSRGGCGSAASSRRAARISSPTCTSGMASPRRSGAGTRALRRSRAPCRSPPVPSGRGSTLSIMTIYATMMQLVLRLFPSAPGGRPGLHAITPQRSSGCAMRSRAATSTRSTSSSTSRRAFVGDPGALAVTRLAPSRHTIERLIDGDGWAIVSGSPELFLARRGRRVGTLPDQGHAPARTPSAATELARVGEGRRRARDDRRPRAQRPLADLRARERALARADGDASRSPASITWCRRVEGTLRAGVGLRASCSRDVPRRLDHRRAEDRARRPDRRARAGRAWGFDGRARSGLRQRRPRSRADDPDLRDR